MSGPGCCESCLDHINRSNGAWSVGDRCGCCWRLLADTYVWIILQIFRILKHSLTTFCKYHYSLLKTHFLAWYCDLVEIESLTMGSLLWPQPARHELCCLVHEATKLGMHILIEWKWYIRDWAWASSEGTMSTTKKWPRCFLVLTALPCTLSSCIRGLMGSFLQSVDRRSRDLGLVCWFCRIVWHHPKWTAAAPQPLSGTSYGKGLLLT